MRDSPDLAMIDRFILSMLDFFGSATPDAISRATAIMTVEDIERRLVSLCERGFVCPENLGAEGDLSRYHWRRTTPDGADK